MDIPTVNFLGCSFLENISANNDIYLTTASLLYLVLEGKGKTDIENETFFWEIGDVLIIPPWKKFTHTFHEKTIMILISNKPILEKLFLLRNEKPYD